MRILRDTEIAALISEPKPLPENWPSHFRVKEKSRYQYEEQSVEITGTNGNVFRVILRRNRINIFDFSIILMFRDKDGKEYRLLRYNGKHPSEHTNKWEKEHGHLNHTFSPVFHIHRATERYQESGYPIDGFAARTTAYYDFHSALDRFLKDSNLLPPKGPQLSLFERGASYDT